MKLIQQFILPSLIALTTISCATPKKEVSSERQELMFETHYAITSELDLYKLECGHFPTTDQGLIALMQTPAGSCPDRLPSTMKKIPKDPYGGEWIYTSDGKTYQLKSLGKDQAPGGTGENADQAPNEIFKDVVGNEPPSADAQARSVHYARVALIKKMLAAPVTKQNVDRFESQTQAFIKSSESFRKDWSHHFALHHGNLMLGRVALFKRDIPTAKKYLMKATEIPLTPQSPHLSTIGPNMTLAKELLQAKEKSAVLEYLDAARVFWTSESAPALIDRWKKEINENKIPNFGYNLKT